MSLSRKILFGLAIVVIAGQFFRPDRTNPPENQADTIYASLNVPAGVHDIFERACIDCHSNRTEWPLYTEISPVSWYVVDHVEEARDELNFSNWKKYPPKRSAHKLEELCENVEERDMPLSSYLLIHRGAKLSEEDVDLLCSWSDSEREAIEAANPEAFVDDGEGEAKRE
jgi:Haem-binding domain